MYSQISPQHTCLIAIMAMAPSLQKHNQLKCVKETVQFIKDTGFALINKLLFDKITN